MLHKLLGLHVPMPARDHQEKHRAATTLELLYDLVAVIAIAFTVGDLHHAINENHIAFGLVSFLMIFWAVWWAWMSFTWFASYYDTDDTAYRLAVFVQLLGYLVIAAGVEQVFAEGDFAVVTAGYIIMRLSLVSLWIRVYRHVPQDKTTAGRYVIGTVLCQIAWAGLMLYVPQTMMMTGFLILVFCEHCVPFHADKKRHSKWHKHHIVERYGLLIIIVLGETLLSLVVGIKTLIAHYHADLLFVLVGGLVALLSLWWLYFSEREHPTLTYSAKAFIWGYGHYFIFASIAAMGAGLSAMIDLFAGHSNVSKLLATASVLLPISVFLIAFWAVHDAFSNRSLAIKLSLPISTVLILLLLFIQHSILAASLILSVLLVLRLWLFNLTNATSNRS